MCKTIDDTQNLCYNTLENTEIALKINEKGGDNLKKLRELRKARRLTLAEVANAIGIKQQVLSYYERGDREPRVETLKKLAKFYGVSIDYLVSD